MSIKFEIDKPKPHGPVEEAVDDTRNGVLMALVLYKTGHSNVYVAGDVTSKRSADEIRVAAGEMVLGLDDLLRQVSGGPPSSRAVN